MNLQDLMRQAQSMQKKMLDSKSKIDSMVFEGKSELVTVKMTGKRKLTEVKIKEDIELDKDDLEILEDMIAIAVNDALGKIEKEINSKLGSQASGLEGLL